MTRTARDRWLDVKVQREAMRRLRQRFSSVTFDADGFHATHVDSRIRLHDMPTRSLREVQSVLGSLATIDYVNDREHTYPAGFWMFVPNQRAWTFAATAAVLGVIGKVGLIVVLLARLASS